MKYIIMCGVCYLGNWEKPKHLSTVNGEVLIERTIRLLQENGVTDIAITGLDERFAELGVEFIKYDSNGMWLNAFYFLDEPICYLLGDVYFSPEAIKTIVEAEVKDIEFFASAPPFDTNYPKPWAEPFAFKVNDYKGFRNAVGIAKQFAAEGKFRRDPICWELWQVIKGTPLNRIIYTNYTVINDYTSDLDYPADIGKLEKRLKQVEADKQENYLIHACSSRMWYVDKYLIPSLQEQGCKNISVYVDDKKERSLKAHMNSFLQLPENDESTWHIQDDVIVCRDFKKRTQQYSGGIICGFASQMYDGDRPAGRVSIREHWFSFPCIRIPNKIAIGCAKWVLQYIIGNVVYREYWKDGKNEDWAFWAYVKDYCKNEGIFNLAPNLVDHIDYLLGGSVNKSTRKEICRSKYWNDGGLVEDLERRLK